MNKLLNMVANGKLSDFKDALKQACDQKLTSAKEDLKQEVGKQFSNTEK